MSENKTKKNIWIFNHYAGSPNTTVWLRHYNFAKNLLKKGYTPTVIAASSRHNNGKNLIEDNSKVDTFQEEYNNINFIYLKARDYNKNGLGRAFNMLDYYFGLFKISKKLNKPDCILASSVHPLTCLAGVKIAKKLGIPCIVEIRDLWPESIVAYKNISSKNIFIFMLRMLEKYIYVKADRIIFTMAGGQDYIHERGWSKSIPDSKIYNINNGVDLEDFYNNYNYYRNKEEITQSDCDSNIDNKPFKIVYTGSISLANGMDKIVDVANILKNRNYDDIKLYIYGSGSDLEELKLKSENLELNNIFFLGHVSKQEIPHILSNADALLLHAKQSPISRFGMSMNKLFDYMAAGKPIISDIKTKYDPIEKYNCGVVSNSPNPGDVADAIIKIYNMEPEDRIKMGGNAKKGIEEFEFSVLTNKLINIIEEL